MPSRPLRDHRPALPPEPLRPRFLYSPDPILDIADSHAADWSALAELIGAQRVEARGGKVYTVWSEE